jgi:hypothetical protein
MKVADGNDGFPILRTVGSLLCGLAIVLFQALRSRAGQDTR